MKVGDFLETLLSEGGIRMDQEIVVEVNGTYDKTIQNVYVDNQNKVCIEVKVSSEDVE